MTFIIKLNGFGSAVIQRLCKTSVKKNLYWEIKDKIIEETFNGVRVEKRPRKVKVYGLDSTKNIRARLIEILMERVMYHKDKFVAPILHEEMKSMQVKKNGKVEHSDTTHDDQVFSYLMALYVWYDGHNLIENFGIRKSTIKTDADEELEELDIEDSLEAKEKVDFNSCNFEANEEIAKELEWLENDSKLVTTDDIAAQQYIRRIEKRNIMIATNKDIANSMELDTGVNTVNMGYAYAAQITELSDSLFTDNELDDYLNYNDHDPNNPRGRSVLQGNLSSYYDLL